MISNNEVIPTKRLITEKLCRFPRPLPFSDNLIEHSLN